MNDVFTCKICGKTVQRNKHQMNMGNLCNSCRQKYRQLKMKQKAIDYLGGKCSICGYNKCNDALEFHHIDSKTKEFNISSNFNLSWEIIKNELDKCKLLCSNCHKELHCSEKIRPTDYKEYEKYININNSKKSNNTKEERIKFILTTIKTSDIDFSSAEWSEQLSHIIGMSRQATVRWIRKNMPIFYANKCYKINHVKQSDIDIFVNMYSHGIKINDISAKTGFCVDTISKCLSKNKIVIEQNNFKHIGMYDKNNNLIKYFSSISEAGQYAETCFVNKYTNISKLTACRSIRLCINNRQKTAYGFIWKEIT